MGTRPNASACRDCRTDLATAAYIRIGQGVLRGGTAICLNCLDKGIEAGGFKSVREWSVAYIERVRPRTEVERLRAEVEELRALVSQLTEPDPASNGRGSRHTPVT
jgi:hypothetical protein